MIAMADWKSYPEERQPRYLDELLDFLRIPSISALPEHACRRPRRRVSRPAASREAASASTRPIIPGIEKRHATVFHGRRIPGDHSEIMRYAGCSDEAVDCRHGSAAHL